MQQVKIDWPQQLEQRVWTDAKGNYQVKEFPIDRHYSLLPVKNTAPLNGVSTLDILIIQDHILGVAPLKDPYELIAADVNKSGSITMADLVEIRQLLLGQRQQFSNNTSWVFVPAEHEFTGNPLESGFPESYEVSLFNATGSIDFVGIKVGDLSGNVQPNQYRPASDRSASQSLQLQIKDQNFVAGESVSVTISAREWEAIRACQFALSFDESQLSLNKLTPHNKMFTLGQEDLFFDESNGHINLSWHQAKAVSSDLAAMYTLQFTALSDGRLSDALQLNTARLEAAAFDESQQLWPLKLAFIQTGEDLQLSQNFPNPVRTQTSFEVVLPEESTVHIRFFDLAGRTLKMYDGGRLPAGAHRFDWNRLELSTAPGKIFYEVEAAGQRLVKSMLLVE